MRLFFAIIIFALSPYQTAFAAVSEGSAESTPASKTNTFKQKTSETADRKEQVISEVDGGRMLYENHCTSCHESAVHMRARRKAKNLEDLIRIVNQRADWLKLRWTIPEKRAVMEYVNKRYYKYPISQ